MKQSRVHNSLGRLKGRLGEFWWSSLLLFCAQRTGDVLNAFIGLWIVPKYVPQVDLGALLPLIQVASFLMLPLSILLSPAQKFLNVYAANGEFGKLKALLRDSILAAAAYFLLALAFGRYVMPAIFLRMHVEAGSLGLLVMGTGLIMTLNPTFINIQQALKKFRLVSTLSVLGSPLRLAVMLAAMPFRPISGYFVGQAAPYALNIGATVVSCRKYLGRDVKARSYWCDRKEMARYIPPSAVGCFAGTLEMLVTVFVIRHNLSGFESAGYYVISRFAEIAFYGGMTLIFVLFPMASEAHERGGGDGRRLMMRTIYGSAFCACGLAVAYQLLGGAILGATATWRPYACFAPYLVLHTVIGALKVTAAGFYVAEIASRRFSFYRYQAPIIVAECAILYCFGGWEAFRGILPDGAVDWMASLNPRSLYFVTVVMFAASLLQLALVFIHIAVNDRRARAKNSC